MGTDQKVYFCSGVNINPKLITYEDKIVIISILQSYVFNLQQLKVLDKFINSIMRLRQIYFVLIVDIICIGHITSYLPRNVHPIFHIYPYNVDYWLIASCPVCNII